MKNDKRPNSTETIIGTEGSGIASREGAGYAVGTEGIGGAIRQEGIGLFNEGIGVA